MRAFSILRKLSLAASGAALIALSGGVAQAAEFTILADTTGSDNVEDADFFGISFVEGLSNTFIQSVAYDLSVDGNAFFDFDGDLSFANATEPLLNLGSLVGLTASDISFDFAPDHPTLLTINFASGSFGVGDSFRFGADTDFLISDPAPGSVFGVAGVPFSVRLEDGTSGSARFTQISSTRSEATVGVPEPTSVLGLLAFGVLGTGLGVKRKQQQKITVKF